MIANSPRNFALRVLVLVGFLVAWEAAVRVLAVPAFIVPAPSSIFVALYRGFASGVYAEHLWVTLSETMLGFAFGCVLAFALGIAVALSPRFEYFLYPFIVMFQALPKVALAPLILVWLGTGMESKLAIAWLVAFFPIVVDTATGLRNTPAEFLDLATAVRASPFQTFWKIRFPAALPFVISGSKVAITLAVIGAVIGEFIGSNEGLGNLLLVANSQINIPLAFACLIGLAAIGIGLYGAVAAVELALKPWFGETVNG
jgi:NitT/TauT family transport system permease protein